MIHNNKVLTVSYGTFSCTLEGFDDAFDTMKAIAEYFRDLAADDRYFGAEPPQPDADTLARIAQTRIARQVEARRDGDGFVLRAGAPAIMAAPPPHPAPETVAGMPPAPAPAPAAPQRAEMPGTSDITEDRLRSPVPAVESIAAKLQRIRAVVSRNQDATEDYSEDEHAEAVSRATPAPPTATARTMIAQADDIIAGDEIDFDAMLDRLETADSRTGTPDAVADGLFGHVDGSGDNDDDDDAFEQDRDLANILEQDQFDDGEDDDEGVDALDDDFDDLDEDDDFDEDDAEPVDRIVAPPPAPERARLVKVRRSRIAAAIASGELEEVAEDEPAPMPVAAAAPAPAPTPKPAPAPAGTLSLEDEADLIRELAQVEAEFIGPDEDADQPEPAPEARAEPPATDRRDDRPRARLADLEDGNGDDVNRLMDATDRKLVDPEAAARHEAYSRMRAAVAATRAERSAGGTLGTHASDTSYRDDLASVVRPRRLDPGQPRPGRPGTQTRSAPLRLVAEQRVDEQAGTAARTSVRPRRVTTQLLDEMAETGTPTPEGGFAQFAEQSGARDLPDLLEAAAAYLSFVEGREQFSRPQLMSKVRQVGGDAIRREDSLRSFGQLLREGKIEKKGGGRFAASNQIGFRPGDDERAVG